MAHPEYSTSSGFDDRCLGHEYRGQLRAQSQSLVSQWQRYPSGEEAAPAYSHYFWSDELYGQTGSNDQNGYPESSQRTALSPSPHHIRSYPHDHSRSVSRASTYSSGNLCQNDAVYAGMPYAYSDSAPSPPFLQSRPASAGQPYQQQHTDTAPSQYTPSQQSRECSTLKVEAAEDAPLGFVMEPGTSTGVFSGVFLSPLPMEVPLRATQASGDMRKMMNVFRLNPFAHQHDSKRNSGLTSAESSPRNSDARPLEEEPVMFEFQIELDRPDLLMPDGDDSSSTSSSDDGKSTPGAQLETPLPTPSLLPSLVIRMNDTEGLHTFPPEFRLSSKEDLYDSAGSDYCNPGRAHMVEWSNQDFGSDDTPSLYSWDGDRDLDSSECGRRSAVGHQPSLLRLNDGVSVTHPYIRKSAASSTGRSIPYHHQQQLHHSQPRSSPPHASSAYGNNHPAARFSYQHGASEYYPPSVRMGANPDVTTTSAESYLEDGSGPATMHAHPLAASMPHRTTMGISSSNHGLYTQEPMVAADELGHDHHHIAVSETATGISSALAGHRRWSLPEQSSSSSPPSLGHHGHHHGHSQIMVPSLSQPFLVPSQ
ncbi:hypothetical protein FA15DRAFT_758248 [Coprinopsis marcescibilis]|uniref:Uncharacterized protein n=1 Tax=Coprinopsis marcescibilis TaxID=230819 RepID=A0A5C3KNV3_COPMA|nr:hypothetical protein FA15DRAFT_758248 [Coprinopsis marcescibilis]